MVAKEAGNWTQISNSVLIQEQTGLSVSSETALESSYQKFP